MLALPEVLTPYPIPAYPKNPPPKWPAADSLKRLGASDLQECNVLNDGAELAVRYEVTRGGDCFIKAVKLNGTWHDPIEWGMLHSVIKVLENECAEIEREVRAEGVE